MNQFLVVDQLCVEILTPQGPRSALDQISLQITQGKTLGIVGESGCGKSMTALSILGLLPSGTQIQKGQIRYLGRNLLTLTADERRRLLGSEISSISQDTMNSLNPVFSCGDQISEVLRLHRPEWDEQKIRNLVIETLEQVGISEPQKRFHSYPHELSGGMRQRVMIAMAIIGRPKLLIADEPTTALDTTVQLEILDLILRLQKEIQMTLLLITHDLGVVAKMCDTVAVMYLGQIVEQGTVRELFERPQHPYTRGLLDSFPGGKAFETGQRLKTIPGFVPGLYEIPSACRFHTRCLMAQAQCRESRPTLAAHRTGENHWSACFFPLLEPSENAGLT